VSYPEFKAHALCTRATEFFDDIEQTIDDKITRGISDVCMQLNKRNDSFRASMYQQHGSLIGDIKQFRELVEKRINKLDHEKDIQHISQRLSKINKDNIQLNKTNKCYRFYLIFITLIQAIIVGLVLARGLGYI
jgi:hypothetical protein